MREKVLLGVLFLVGLGVGPWTGQYRVITVLSGSMAPHYPVGALLVSTPEPVEQAKVGQVISYNAPVPGQPVVTHRLIQVDQVGSRLMIRTRGDANTAADPWTAQIDRGPLWRTRFAVPYLGFIIRQLRRPGVHATTVLVLPGLYGLLAVFSIWAPKRPGANERPQAA